MANAKTTPPPEDTVTLTRAEIASMIADALQARDEDEPTGPPPGMELAQAIGDAVAMGLEKNNPKKVTYGAYLKRPTENHPLGVLSPKFSRQYFMNGRQITYDAVNDQQVLLLNQITHSGRYHDRKVEVIVRDDGGDSQYVEFRKADASVDQRMDLKSLFRNFTELVQGVVDAQKLEREEEERNPRRTVSVRRPFGSSKATLDAEAAAAAAQG